MKIEDVVTFLKSKGHDIEVSDNGFQAVSFEGGKYTVLTIIKEDGEESVEVEVTTRTTSVRYFETSDPQCLDKLHQYLTPKQS